MSRRCAVVDKRNSATSGACASTSELMGELLLSIDLTNWMHGALPNEGRWVCCFFSDGNRVWPEDVWADAGDTPVLACFRRAHRFSIWKLLFANAPRFLRPRIWRVLQATEGECDVKRTTTAGHGRYCGPLRAATCDPAIDKPPIDEVDEACLIHDCCLPTIREYFNPEIHRCCNIEFCTRLARGNCAKSIFPEECESYRKRAHALCLATLGLVVPLP